MFLAGTFHVLVIYIIFGLILCLPPLLLPQWKSLVQYLNKKEIQNKKLSGMLLIGTGSALAVISIILMALYNPYLLNPIMPELSEFGDYIFFSFFSFFSFILLPFGLALIASASYVWYSSNPRLGNFSIVLLAICAMGLAGSFLHDVIWCGTITTFFTQEYITTSFDLNWWCVLLFVESKDYRVFGFYMIILIAVVLLPFAIILLWRHETFLEKKHKKSAKIMILLLSASVIIVLGVALYIMDYKRFFTLPWAFTSVYIMVPISVLFAYYLGKKLSK